MTWIVAAIAAGALIGGFHYYAAVFEVPPSAAFLVHNQNRIDRFAQMATEFPHKPRVVMLGNSTLKYATRTNEDTFELAGCKEVLVLRIVNNWARFIDFEPLSDAILSSEPDLIVVQPEILFRSRVREIRPRPDILRDYVYWRAFGLGEWDPHGFDQHDLQTAQPDFDDQSDERFANRYQRLNEWQRMDLTGASARASRRFLQRARQQGIRVVMLYPPMTSRGRTLIDPIRDELKPVLTDYLKDPAVELLECPYDTADDEFSDFVHMNDRGRDRFMAWFVPNLRNKLGLPDGHDSDH